ncbi:3D domain-containing protein [Pygmaiobacter massiliensis]|uniref:3D domain-containing protein n=1 Tax=Pygmaiobacter massiliensis TaxID=1917873 RepID=UPI001FA9068F|nr:3D domain-containing protein [Pygmaiobacter massiliensis]
MNTQNLSKPRSTDEILARKYRTAYQAERHRAERLSFYTAGMAGVVLLLGFVIANGMQTQKALLDSANATIERLTIQQKETAAAETMAFQQTAPIEVEYLGEFDCTAYCCEAYPHICGTGTGITASGAPVAAGASVSADPEVIPLGSWIYIEGVGIRQAQDIGSKVKQNKLDVAVDTHENALHWSGYGSHKVYLLSEGVQQ